MTRKVGERYEKKSRVRVGKGEQSRVEKDRKGRVKEYIKEIFYT